MQGQAGFTQRRKVRKGRKEEHQFSLGVCPRVRVLVWTVLAFFTPSERFAFLTFQLLDYEITAPYTFLTAAMMSATS